jgi:hypothetical protein
MSASELSELETLGRLLSGSNGAIAFSTSRCSWAFDAAMVLTGKVSDDVVARVFAPSGAAFSKFVIYSPIELCSKY